MYNRTCLILLTSLSMMLISSTSWSKTFRYPESTRPSSLIPFFVDQMSAVRITEFLFEPLVKKK
jgi:hypothetical protein